jgi:hypothetical protein
MTIHGAFETKVLRPAAPLAAYDAACLVAQLQRMDVGAGGVWDAGSTIWHRYDQPWNGRADTRGDAELVGTIALKYDAPRRQHVDLFHVTITEFGSLLGWTARLLCDDALALSGRTLTRDPLSLSYRAPHRDPFHRVSALAG